MFERVMIANRGAIATRIIRTLKKMGVQSIAVYHEKDQHSLHVQLADVSVNLGSGSVSETYLNQERLIQIAKETGADAIHPGYGFLSENPSFVEKCTTNGVVFIGPTTEQMHVFGLKHLAREAAEQAQVPMITGSPVLEDLDSALAWADQIGFPVMLKSSAGGGGIGMQVCHDKASLTRTWDSVRRMSANYFSDDTVFVEKFVDNARHIEVQIFGDGQGNAIAIGERDCSAQRRNQKVIEECPAPRLSNELRESMHRTAEDLMKSVKYRNAGTVEFIFDVDQDKFYFLEVNTRLQVEHGVTEEVFGIDLVEWMLKQAAGELEHLEALRADLKPSGHSIQVRLYAEDTHLDFQPSAGLLSEVHFPQGDHIRVDTWVEAGIEVPALFDPMIAKVIVTRETRETALASLADALQDSRLYGIETNLDYVVSVLTTDAARYGQLLTKSLAGHRCHSKTLRVLNAGTQTTVQDYPGRQGFWHVGVPPSGPMDSLSFRLANRLLNNPPTAAGIEMTVSGPTLQFDTATIIALTGADMQATLDGEPVPRFESVAVSAGQVLALGAVAGNGARGYLAVAGGIQCPAYLGSKATFTLGQFGGHTGRALRTGDVLHLDTPTSPEPTVCKPLPLPDTMALRVLYGPHGAPDFFTDQDIEQFFASEWQVHYNSSRTGVRLIGPKPAWARPSGGEAGMHPSNIHDNAYAFGTVDFTGDMPVILGPDGPSLGGFVCPATVISADLWKLGQLTPGQRLKFVPVSYESALEAETALNEAIEQLATPEAITGTEQPAATADALASPIVKRMQWGDDDLVIRIAGDHFILIEAGPQALDIPRRVRIHALMEAIERRQVSGVKELTPGIRSLQVHYDSQEVQLADLLDLIQTTIEGLDSNNLAVTSRIVHLPLSWDDEVCQVAIQKYMQSVRSNAPWCPSNLEFIRRMNGLGSIEDVKRIVFDASYLVMGLGDVYLGAPVATPMDPRHRLITTKYNPARTWTAENSVGIGGAYLCVYGMEGPGGYQFVGRTSQMWNRYRTTPEFSQPWLLRFFDQLRFYEVSADELTQFRRDLPVGKASLRIEETEFSLGDYQAWLDQNQDSIGEFTASREQAFEEELKRWRDNGQFTFEAPEAVQADSDPNDMPAGSVPIESAISGNVWKLEVTEGDSVVEGQTLLVLESMKMEISVQAQTAGTINKLLVDTGQDVLAGQCLVWLEQSMVSDNV